MWVENSVCFLEINHASVGNLLLNVEKINSIKCDVHGIEIISDKESWHLNFPTTEEKLKAYKSIRDCVFPIKN